MLVSTKGRYALRVMIDLAGHNDGSLVRLQDIADRQQISEKYLEGSRPSAEYTACQIIETIEERIAPISCLKAPENTCGRRQFCCTLPMWEQLDHLIRDYLQSVTLKDLAEGALSDLPCSLSSPSNNHVNHQ